jgi:peptidoglycan/LPS O-acetylase OafA/YrhL
MNKIALDLSFANTQKMRGIAILFVIIGHLRILDIASWGVGLFLFMSGYGLTTSFLKNGLENFFQKRALKIWLPFVLLFVVELFVDYSSGTAYPLKSIVWSLTGLNLYPMVDASMWYIGYSMIWYILFFVIFKICKHTDTKRLIFLLSLATLFMTVLSLSPLAMKAAAAWWYVFCFPLGVFCALYYEKIRSLAFSKTSVALLGVAVVSLFALEFYLSYLLFFINIYVAVVFFLLLFSIKTVIVGKLLAFTGSISYEIYLFEFVLIYKYRFCFLTDTAFDYLIYFAVVVLISYLYKRLMDRIINFLIEIMKTIF